MTLTSAVPTLDPAAAIPGGRDPGRRRRRVVAATAGLLLAAGLVGCGSDADGSATPEGEAPAVTAPVEEGAFPVEIEHEYGTTEITEQPTRVVVVGLTEQDALLALGITPVGTTEWFGDHDGAIWPWAQDEREALGDAEITVLDNTDGIPFERVRRLRPDLIIGLYSDLSETDYATLADIADTLAPPKDATTFGVSWQDQTRIVGQAVGQPQAADDLVTEIEARFAEAREAHPEFEGRSAAIATPFEGTFVYGSDDPRGRFVEALGFEIPEELSTIGGDRFGGQLSAEQAELLDVDTIIWLDVEDKEGDAPLAGPVYDQLAVHTEGREVFLDSESKEGLGGATSFVTVLSLAELIDGLVPRLALAVDGDPATEVPSELPAD